MHSVFQYKNYLLKRQLISLTGIFRIYNPNDGLVLYCKQKIFRVKEDIRVYSDERQSQELLHIKARQVIDFSANYDVYDSFTNERVGMLRRKGINSMARDTWMVFDKNDSKIGVLQEDDLTRAFLRRILLGSFLPLNYDLISNDHRVAHFRQLFNLLRYELEFDFGMDTEQKIDRRLGVAAGILLATIEGRQN